MNLGNDFTEISNTLGKAGIGIDVAFRVSGESYIEVPVKFGISCGIDKSRVGMYSYTRDGVYISNSDIGRYCSIASNVSIGVDVHPVDGLTTSSFVYDMSNFSFYDGDGVTESWTSKKATTIGNDVWIGLKATILPGVTIQHGSIVGAHALVARDIEPYSIVGGVPARLIRRRFSDDIIDRLLTIEWWNYDIRSWLLANREFRTIPLDNEKLDTIERAILNGSLKQANSAVHSLVVRADGLHLDP